MYIHTWFTLYSYIIIMRTPIVVVEVGQLYGHNFISDPVQLTKSANIGPVPSPNFPEEWIESISYAILCIQSFTGR